MKFLLEDGFSQDLIQQMKTRYDMAIIYQFSLEEENVRDVIRYFKRIGIERIDLLLLTRIEIFMKDINEVKDAFLRHNIKKIVDEINLDINKIDCV
ncbi:MAG: hypothetical protein IKF71_03695 [Bacilli bacterium]|nr:hypothetical protein [Bacilli bacterium]